jgi:hypothetical protein
VGAGGLDSSEELFSYHVESLMEETIYSGGAGIHQSFSCKIDLKIEITTGCVENGSRDRRVGGKDEIGA